VSGPRDEARDFGDSEKRPGSLGEPCSLEEVTRPLGEFTSPELAEDCARFLEQARKLADRRPGRLRSREAG